ncbi:MAG TPA: hypothetical protein VIM93_05855 [Kangiella sp.]
MNTNKLRTTYWVIAALLMLSAATANQFYNEFNWDKLDFLVFGIILLGAGLAIELVLIMTKKPPYRLISIIVIALAFLLLWVELAVGIFH